MLTATWDRLSPIESEVLELVDLFRYCAAPRRLEIDDTRWPDPGNWSTAGESRLRLGTGCSVAGWGVTSAALGMV